MEEHRHFIRHPVCFPLSYRMVPPAKSDQPPSGEGKATTINISVGGLMFSATHPADIGSKVAIKIPFQDRVFNVKGNVVHCEKSIETKFYNVGINFYRITDAFKVKLIEQIYLISEFRDLWSVQQGREVSLEEASREWIKRYSARFKRLYW